MLAKVSSARSVSRCRLFSRSLHLLHGDRDGNEHRHVPGMADREQRERRAEPDLAGARHESRIEVSRPRTTSSRRARAVR